MRRPLRLDLLRHDHELLGEAEIAGLQARGVDTVTARLDKEDDGCHGEAQRAADAKPRLRAQESAPESQPHPTLPASQRRSGLPMRFQHTA